MPYCLPNYVRLSDIEPKFVCQVCGKRGTDIELKRANLLFTRTLQVQWVQGDASVAETSFFKINSQGTPLDELEQL